jgi:spectrin beta
MDEKTVIMYLIQYYEYFARLQTEGLERKRLTNFVDFLLEAEQLQNQYEAMARALIGWLQSTAEALAVYDFPNDMGPMQAVYSQFKQHVTAISLALKRFWVNSCAKRCCVSISQTC